MLPPEYLEGLPEPILELYALVEDDILRDMARRIAAFDYYIPAADWQNLKLKEAGRMQEDILKVLAKYTGRSEEELRKLMEKATSDGLRSDISVYEAHGETVPPISDSKRLVDTLNAGYAATRGTMRNITRTTANTATQQFERALDKAWLQVRSGGFGYDTAVRSAVKELAGRGVEAIRYPTGHVDTLETAVRRAVVTGINQTTCRLQEELAAEMGMDLVEVSAHAGARPSHAVWQGKIFSLSGSSTKYPKFAEATGYGTGPGLGGWNCRHSFSPYYEGSPRAYPPELLEKYEAKDIEYNGEKMTEYEASQKQRYMERQVRRWKREKEALEAAGQDSGEARKKIREWQAALRDFTDQTGLKRQNAREQIGVAGDKKAVANPLKSGIINKEAAQERGRFKSGTNADTRVSELVATEAYIEQFRKLGESEKITNILAFQARTTLWRRSGTEFEDLIFTDAETGKTLAQRKDDRPKACMPTKKMRDMVEEGKPRTVIAMHNHPHSVLPSLSDISNAKRYRYGVILCHDGTLIKYQVSKNADVNTADSFLDIIQRPFAAKEDITGYLSALKETGVHMEVYYGDYD